MKDKSRIKAEQINLRNYRGCGRGRRVFWIIALISVAVIMTGYLGGCTGKYRNQRGWWHEDVSQKIQRGTEWALMEVEATDEQRQKIEVILQDLTPVVHRWHEERKHLKEQFLQALQAEQVNAKELEVIQSTGAALADEAFNRTIQMALQVSEVLMPEQRKELVAKWSEHK